MFAKAYKDQKPVGVWRYFDKNKQLEQTVRYNNGHADVKEYFVNGVMTERTKFLMEKDDYWFFAFDLAEDAIKMHVEFRINKEEIAPNQSEFNAFYAATGINSGTSLVEAPYKFGRYSFENDLLKYEGDYSGGGFKMGAWTRVYKQAKVTAQLEYDDTGSLIKEFFVKSNGKPYSGKLKYTAADKSVTTMEIKKGLRNGTTMEVDASGKVIYQEIYENGFLAE
jgi:antitoxin component YwqK of YwqJK toxin-antitoxin module